MTRSRFSLVLVALMMLISHPLVAFADRPGAFDYYLFEQSWLPEFCAGTVARKSTQMPHPECGDIETRFGATHPTVHGLWPQNDGGNFPSDCAGSPGCDAGAACPLDEHQLDDALEKELQEKWMPGYPNLESHEWKKHGTCSGLDQQGYFVAVVALAAKVPAREIPVTKIGREVDLSELRAWWGEPRAAFRCDRRKGKQFLAAVRTCWERAADLKPGSRFACPPNVADTCTVDKKIVLSRARNLSGHGRSVESRCNKPGQGPACKSDKACEREGWLRCAKSGCCTNQKQ